MKKFISILAIFSIAMSFCFQTASAAIVSGVMTETNVVSSVLTVSLSEYLARATDDDVVQVTIELKDDIDLNDVEEKAISRANISSTEMAALNVNTFSLGEEDNESLQLVTLKVFDRVSRERNSILKNHYSTKNENFILSAGLQDKKIESVGLFTPFIRGVSLTKAQILEVAKNPMVCLIDYVEGQYAIDCDNINNTYKIVGGDTFTNAGYSGSGIRVGLVEQYHPITTKMGSDGDGIVNVNTGSSSDHATMTSGIIKKFAPSCTIYSYALGYKPSLASPIAACETLIDKYDVHVINMSIGANRTVGSYTAESRALDWLVRNNKVTIVAAAGNLYVDGDGVVYDQVSPFGVAGNVITVGAVTSSGTNPDASSAYSFPSWSLYKESTPMNKPDICAPGVVTIYSLTNSGTSFATPHVTGTVIQMMARNSAFIKQPQKIKASVLASGTRNCGTSMSYIGKEISNEEGAGVLDADFCYRVSRAGRATHFDVTSSFTSSNPLTQQVYCDYVTKPFRIACTWEVAATSSGTSINVSDYDMRVYKDGVQVASSMISVGPTKTKGSNSEIIEIPTSDLSKYGGGYYEVRISPYGSFYGTGTVRIGLAWEQD